MATKPPILAVGSGLFFFTESILSHSNGTDTPTSRESAARPIVAELGGIQAGRQRAGSVMRSMAVSPDTSHTESNIPSVYRRIAEGANQQQISSASGFEAIPYARECADNYATGSRDLRSIGLAIGDKHEKSYATVCPSRQG